MEDRVGESWQGQYNKSVEVELLYILGAVVLVSLVSLVGLVYFVFSEKLFNRIIPWLVAFAAGTILGVAFFNLIPESTGELGTRALGWVVAGILLFLFFEQVMHWHHQGHHHDCEDCPQRLPLGYSILLVDGLHNFLDGVIIASAFLADVHIGIAATVAVLFHEVPQEIGDFAILLHSGFKKMQAIWFNLLSALMAIVGALVAYLALNQLEFIIPYAVAVGAGGLLYIALVDLLSEFKANKSLKLSIIQLLMVIAGVLIMARL